MMELTKEEIEYWNDRKSEIHKFEPIDEDDFQPPSPEEQVEIEAEIERIMEEYYS